MRRRYGIVAIVLGAAAWIGLVAEDAPNEGPGLPGPRSLETGSIVWQSSGPRPAASWLDAAALAMPGFGEIRFRAADGNALRALVYRSTRFDPGTGPILFVMHGASRNAERYVRTAAPLAERRAALAIAIEFAEEAYPSGSDYTLGVTTTGPADGHAWAERRWRDPQRYLYAEVERLFEAVRAELGGRQSGYFLFGHSAGAQFTHRLMTFMTDARVLRAVAANAGWYTLPAGGGDAARAMPYGLGGTPIESRDLAPFFAADLTVLLGERDTTTPAADRLVRGTAEAMAQGPNRLARGRHYFAVAAAEARALGVPFAWRLAVVPRAGHDAAAMLGSADHFLFGEGAPCASTSAADAGGIVITEILADPPGGSRGDANGDGRRDPADDEFVELVNAAATPVCLAGWMLGDADDPERHVFPLGASLGPGEAIVVFGGGVPTGDFGRAHVEHAAYGGRLSLQNAGDTVTLRDASGSVAGAVSWGDCGGGPCAPERWHGSLGIEQSIARRAGDAAAIWGLHGELAAAPFSPGARVDGSPWSTATKD